MDSKDIRPSANESFLNRVLGALKEAEKSNGGMDTGGEWMDPDLTAPFNVPAEEYMSNPDLTGPMRGDFYHNYPWSNEPINKALIPGEDRSQMGLDSLGLQEQGSDLD